MAGTSLLALLDDIASVLDDVALLTKLAAKKTAGVLGDDLAVNAEQVSGVQADRELPVVIAVARGSAINKAILVPVALGISAIAPWLVTPLLMVGGAFLCYEGFEKLAHKWLHGEDEDDDGEIRKAAADPNLDLVAFEKDKIKGAVRTDFVLSAEIIAISLGEVADAEFVTRVIVLVGIAIIMTVGVYGFVGAIVKMDDLGLLLMRSRGRHGFARAKRGVGGVLLAAAPYLMKFLSVAGTVAMFLVGGGILSHGIPPLHHWFESWKGTLGSFAGLATMGANLVLGVIAGAVVLAVVTAASKLRKKRKPAA